MNMMKYGTLFSLIAILLAIYALRNAGWYLLLLWPAASFCIVGGAYLHFGHRVFGKRTDGSMSRLAVVVLLPYLVYLWTIWHVLRLVSSEPPIGVVNDSVLIGRRLLSRELPADIELVVDLTCEFSEPRTIRSARRYIAFPMLDAATLPSRSLVEFVRCLAKEDGRMFIHCAQGHGRTGLITALLLIAKGDVQDADAALLKVQASRPLAGLNSVQVTALRAAAELLVAG